jgi:integrase
MGRNRKWQAGHVEKGTGIYVIRRDIAGISYKRSTRCTTLDGALSELARFERDPAGYIPGGGPRPQRHAFGESVSQWLAYSSQVKGNSQRHVEAQARYFGTWAKFFEQRGLVFLEDITAAMVDEFIAWRRPLIKSRVRSSEHSRGAHSIALEVAALKVMFTWASRPESQGGFLPTNPLERYRLPKRPRGSSVPKVFTMEWWAKVRGQLGERWQNVGDVLLGSSMRYSSLARLRPDDVDIERNTISLRGNAIKGKEGTVVYVSHPVALKAKQLAMQGVHWESHGFNQALESACLKAGERYYSCHAFRHSSASMALEDGCTGKDLQKRLAHARFATTELYLDTLGHKKDPYRGRL